MAGLSDENYKLLMSMLKELQDRDRRKRFTHARIPSVHYDAPSAAWLFMDCVDYEQDCTRWPSILCGKRKTRGIQKQSMFHPDKLRKEHQTAGAEWFKLCTQVHGIVDHLGKMEPSNLQDYLEQAKAQAEAQALSDSCVQLLCAEPCSLETAREVAQMLIDHGEQRAAAAAAPGAAASGLGETKLSRIIRAGVDRLVSQFERLAAEALPTDSRAKAQASLSSHASDASDASDASRWVSCSLCWRELVLDAHDRIATLTAWFLAQVLGDSGDSSAAQQQQQCSLARQVLQHIDLAGGQRVTSA
jgi:hypothetical protein